MLLSTVTFLTPWSAVLAAAIAIPLLLLLYVLRLRRQRLRIPSTLLWMKSFEDLQANVPFQRLRWSLLLLLQLLMLLLLLLALAQPSIRGEEGMATRIVLLIDRSASMNATVPIDETKRTRLDLAKDAAKELVRNLSRGTGAHQVMIIAFGSSAQVVTTFESNRGVLLDAIDSIEPTDEHGNLEDALELAGAFTGAAEEGEESPDVVLLSDGCYPRDSDGGYRLRAGHFRFVQVVPNDAPQTANLGITSFSIRREEDDPSRVLLFARLLNASQQPIDAVLTIWNGEQSLAAVRVNVPAATENTPGEQTITHRLDIPEGALLSIRHNHRDDLESDDAARLVLPAPSRPRIVLVHPNESIADPFLHDLLEAMEPQRLDVISIDRYGTQMASPDIAERYDMIVFDRVSPAQLPNLSSLTVGAAPSPIHTVEASESELETGRPILSWDRQHPVMRNVALDTIVFSGFAGYELPAGATALAFGPDGPIIAELRQRQSRHIAVGFELRRSNWPLHVSSAVFMQNAIDYLTLASRGVLAPGQHGISFHAGEAITVRARADVNEVVIEGPIAAQMTAEPGAAITLPALRQVGWYELSGAAPPFERIAINVASDVESDTRPRESVVVNAEATRARRSDAAARPIWPWLIGAAFALLVLEWLLYCRRASGR